MEDGCVCVIACVVGYSLVCVCVFVCVAFSRARVIALCCFGLSRV